MSNKYRATPTLAQAIRDSIDAKLLDLHTALPARVESYDSTTQTANVQPEIQRKYKDGTVVNLPVINRVPVLMPRAGTSWVHLPIKKGDQVFLVFSERSTDIWQTSGGETDPKDPRRHNLSDAFAIPGGYPLANPMISPDGEAVHINNEIGEMKVFPDGKLSIGNKSVELLDLLDQIIDETKKASDASALITVNTVVGVSSPPNNAATFQLISVALDLIKTQLGSLLK